jgi:hypothetical protein
VKRWATEAQSYAGWVTAQILANTGEWDAAIDLARQ